MQVIANGDPVTLPEGARLPDLFAVLGVGAKWVVAEVNGDAVDRTDMPALVLADGDRVELVRAVAGGCDGGDGWDAGDGWDTRSGWRRG